MDIDDGTNTPEMIAEDMKDTRENVTQEALENAIQGKTSSFTDHNFILRFWIFL